MPTEVDIFIQTLVECAKANDTQGLKTLLNKARSIHLKNSAGLSAAMLLAKENQLTACKTLSDFQAHPYDFIYGAACANNKENIKYFVNQYKLQDLEPIIMGAICGGHQELAQQYIMMLDKDKRKYSAYVEHALRTRNDVLAQVFLKEIPENEHNDKSNAINAALAGLNYLVFYFINKNKELHNYNELALAAAAGGHRELAELILTNLDESKRDYQSVAMGAAKRGFTDLVHYFINKAPEKKRNYFAIAQLAFQGGNYALASLYSTKATQFCESNKFTPVFANSAGAHPPVIHTLLNNRHPAPLTLKLPTKIIAAVTPAATPAIAASTSAPPTATKISTPTATKIPTPTATKIPTPTATKIPTPTAFRIPAAMVTNQPSPPIVTTAPAPMVTNTPAPKNTNEVSKKRPIENDFIDEKNQDSVNDSSKDKEIGKQNSNPRPKKRQRREPLEIDTVEGKRNKGNFIQNFQRSTKAEAKQKIHSILMTESSGKYAESNDDMKKSAESSFDSQKSQSTTALVARFSGGNQKSQEIENPGLNDSEEVVLAEIFEEMELDEASQDTEKLRGSSYKR